VLAQVAFQGVGAFERVGTGDLHLPAVCALRAQDFDTPVAGPVYQDVLDHRDQVALQGGIACVVSFNRNRHRESLRHCLLQELKLPQQNLNTLKRDFAVVAAKIVLNRPTPKVISGGKRDLQ